LRAWNRIRSSALAITVYIDDVTIDNKYEFFLTERFTPDLISPDASYRWMDVADQTYSSSYQNSYQYSQATANVSYTEVGKTLVGKLLVTNLKPNFAYQLKLVGTPGTADSELIGLAGRWWEEEWSERDRCGNVKARL
jgi:hypothetical protein